MKSIAISGSLRKNVGKRDAKELRYEGQVPAVLYGGTTQTHLSVSAADLKAVLYTPEVVFLELNIDGKNVKAIVQDAQFPAYFPNCTGCQARTRSRVEDPTSPAMALPMPRLGAGAWPGCTSKKSPCQHAMACYVPSWPIAASFQMSVVRLNTRLCF